MALLLDNAPLPANDPIARAKRPQYGDRPDPLEGRITDPWLDYMTRQAAVVSQGPTVLSTVSLTSQAASISATDITGAAAAGVYRLTYYAAITQAASTSSSLEIAFAWTFGAVAQSATGTAITGNTTQTWQSSSIMVTVDTNTPIQYSTTYATSGATAMQYALYITLERML